MPNKEFPAIKQGLVNEILKESVADSCYEFAIIYECQSKEFPYIDMANTLFLLGAWLGNKKCLEIINYSPSKYAAYYVNADEVMREILYNLETNIPTNNEQHPTEQVSALVEPLGLTPEEDVLMAEAIT